MDSCLIHSFCHSKIFKHFLIAGVFLSLIHMETEAHFHTRNWRNHSISCVIQAGKKAGIRSKLSRTIIPQSQVTRKQAKSEIQLGLRFLDNFGGGEKPKPPFRAIFDPFLQKLFWLFAPNFFSAQPIFGIFISADRGGPQPDGEVLTARPPV